MFRQNFFTKFIYSKYVFQVRNFYTHDTTEKGGTMFRKNTVQRQASSGKGKLGSSKVNLQERLSLIRQSSTKTSSVTEFKNLGTPGRQNKSSEKTINLEDNEKQRQADIPNSLFREDRSIEKKLLSATEYPKKQSKFPSVVSSPVLPHTKLSISERLVFRNKLFNIKINDTAKLEDFSKNIVNNGSFNSASNKDLNISVNLNRESDVMAIDVEKYFEDKDIKTVKKVTEKRKSTYSVRLQNLHKFVMQGETGNKRTEEQNHLLSTSSNSATKNSQFKNVTSIASISQGKKRTLQDRLSTSRKSNTNLSDKEPVGTIPVDKSASTASLPYIPSRSPTSFDLDLKLIENKLKNLNINKQLDVELDVITQNQNRVLSYNTRLENLKKFVTEDKTKLFSMGIYDKQMDCLPVINRKILKGKRYSQQKRLLSSSRSCDTISNVDNNEQLLKNIQVNGTNHKDVNFNKTLLSNDLGSKLQENFVNPTVPNVKEPLECKHIKVESKSEVQHLYDQYPFPKNRLHSYYEFLLGELKDKSLKVEPLYKLIKTKRGSEWICMYHLKWPENCKVSAQGPTKKEASSFAALRCLSFLSESGKMSSDGLPLIYNKEEFKKLTQKKQTLLKFDDNIIKKMQNIVDIFSNNMSPFINKVDYNTYKEQENKILDKEADSVDFFRDKRPKYLGMHHYVAKEKIVLPISKLKESFIDLIQNNNCVIVKGEPGCGKSSRIPQYVLEAWVRAASSEDQLCRIAVTQPRRIAAISLAERVASERDEELGSIVGYQVRLKSNFKPNTGRILYCTTGILLRHLQSDPNLTKFSHVILDEAHERDVNTDLLVNLMKNALKENDNLKVIVMSATIDADKFSEYYGGAPIFSVPGFTYPVHKRYLDECKLDVSKTLKMCNGDNPRVIHEDVVEVIGYINKNKPEGAILTFLPGWEDLVKVQRLIPARGDVVVHLVHSKLKDSEQYKIFARPPPGVRKIILATNIAETSITIDDVVYVVDTGIQKDQIFDNDKGINVIDMEWVSKASANQRAGRAGRCSPGESYHLYDHERYAKFPEYSSPKILNSSLTKVVLDSKMITNNMDACEFMNSLITPPERVAVERAVDELKQLELLDEHEKLTPLGRTLVNFQLEPNLAKVMVNAVVFKCTTPIVDIVTLFSSETGIFGSLNLTDKDYIKNVKSQFCKNSDHLALMRVYEKWLEISEEMDIYAANRFCTSTKLIPYKMEFVKKLKDIHFGYLYNGLYESLPMSEDFSDNDELVKAVLYSGTGTVLHHRNWDIVKNRLKNSANVLVTRNNQKATITSESVNYKRHRFPSDFLVYINETRSNIRRTTIVRECSLIPPISVLLFSNKELEILKADAKSDNPNDDLVIVGIKNTKLRFLCDKEQANVLTNCKEAIDSSYKYLIHQLTHAGEPIPEFLEHWDNVLRNLGDILDTFRIE